MEIKTQILDALADRQQAAAEAARLLRQGRLVIIPTETVYGLAANALDPAAVAGIFAAKGRPGDNPLIVHIADREMLAPLVRRLPESAKALAEAFWPGPLTLVLPKSGQVPDITSGGLDTVAVRMPGHPTALEIIRRSGLPLAAPSANRSGSPSPTSARHCIADMQGRVDAIVADGDCAVGVESTVLSLTGPIPVLLRPGGVTVLQLREALGRVELHPSVTAALAAGDTAASPGMKYKHYAPAAQLTILHGSAEAFAAYVNRQAAPGVFALCFDEDARSRAIAPPCITYGGENAPEEQARQLFDALRRLDEQGAETVYARAPRPEGIGLAVYNRLLRAAAFREIYL